MGAIKFPHASGNSMSIAAPATNPASDLELKLPATIGTAGQVLKNSSTAGTLEFGGGGKILQVVSTTKNDTSSYSVADGGISGDVITADITPASSSNKVLVILSIYAGSGDHGIYASIYRGGSVITNATGDASGVRQRVSAASFVYNDNRATEINKTYLDSPSTTSSTTYSVRIGGSYTSTGTYYVNQSYQNANENESARGMSTLTLMEIAA